MRAVSDDVGFIFNDPFDGLSLLKLHGLGHGGGEVDVILVSAFLAGDELHFSGISHEKTHWLRVIRITSSIYARRNLIKKRRKNQDSASRLDHITRKNQTPGVRLSLTHRRSHGGL